jgi:hypothetical protein
VALPLAPPTTQRVPGAARPQTPARKRKLCGLPVTCLLHPEAPASVWSDGGMRTSATYAQASNEQGSKRRQPMVGGAGANAPRIHTL